MIARKYAYLVALAREKHFGRAAAACHVSPSTLSTAIRDLEEELGVALVERGQRFAGLTPEGSQVVDQAQRMLAAAESLKQELASRREGLSGCLRVGVIPTALGVVASLTAPFARRHPRVCIRVESASTDEILSRLRDFDLEAGVVYMESCQADDLVALQVWEENHVFLTLADRAGGERTTWREAAERPLCLLTPDMHNRQTIDRVFADLGCQPKVSLETNSIISLLAHVCTGPWSTILPRSVLELIGTPRGVRVLDLEEPAVAWRTGIVTLKREPRSPMVDALLAQARALHPAFEESE
jgi:DNA-binding transcriptional LysR family regulator